MTERRLPPLAVTAEEQAEVNDAPNIMARMDIIIRLVEAAYERGWRDCEDQWTAYADTLETPVARA